MPLYLYECPYHGEFEIEQRITEDALEACPKLVGICAASQQKTVPVITKYSRKIEQCNSPIKRLIAGNVSFTWKNGPPTSKTYV